MSGANSLFHNLKGLTAIVTGAANGLGLGCTQRLVNKGVNVMALDLKKTSLLPSASNCSYMDCDVTKESDVARAIGATVEKYGQPHIVVNSAGLASETPLYDYATKKYQTLEEIDLLVKVNLLGTLNVVRLVVPEMAKNKADVDGQRGMIFNFASICGRDCKGGMAVYAATKAGVAGMCLPLARELSCHGIRCNTVAPGYFDTPLLSGLEGLSQLEQLRPHIPLPSRFGKPEELASLLETMLENTMINGAVFFLDAAHHMPYKL